MWLPLPGAAWLAKSLDDLVATLMDALQHGRQESNLPSHHFGPLGHVQVSSMTQHHIKPHPLLGTVVKADALHHEE